MNAHQIKGGWKALKGTVREQWGRVTGSHQSQVGGAAEKVTGKVEQGYGQARESVERQAETSTPPR